MNPTQPLTAISLFSGGGIGDIALRASDVQVLVANELRPDRASVFQQNFPGVVMHVGDIEAQKESIVSRTKALLQGAELDVLFATPPCQGMSKNGRGKLLARAAQGDRLLLDPRNQLILHALGVANACQPRLVVFENVPEMRNTMIFNEDGVLTDIMEVISNSLGSRYQGSWQVVEFADYGVPQRRKRLITTFTRDPVLKERLNTTHTLLPPATHSRDEEDGLLPWITVEEALSDVPSLDARTRALATGDIPFHRVPTLDKAKYFWVSHTPAGRSAFDNQCANPACGFQENASHGAQRNRKGINQSKKTTPVYCQACGELLPRPWVREEDGSYRIMSGYTSAYKRMRADVPASALTRNLSYACSDHKVHPTENRVLSLYEAFRIHTVDEYAFDWQRADSQRLADKTIREILGESIPPKGLERIFTHLAMLLRL